MAIKTFTDLTTLPASDINTYLANAGLVFVKEQAVGALPVVSVTVTNAFSAEYENYLITWSGGNMNVVADVGVQLQGLTVNGYFGSQYFDSYTGINGINRINNGTSWVRVGGGDAATAMLSIELFGPNLAKQTNMTFKAFTAGAFTTFGAGLQTSTAQSTGFIVFGSAAGNTMANGVIRVYGYRQA